MLNKYFKWGLLIFIKVSKKKRKKKCFIFGGLLYRQCCHREDLKTSIGIIEVTRVKGDEIIDFKDSDVDADVDDANVITNLRRRKFIINELNLGKRNDKFSKLTKHEDFFF